LKTGKEDLKLITSHQIHPSFKLLEKNIIDIVSSIDTSEQNKLNH